MEQVSVNNVDENQPENMEVGNVIDVSEPESQDEEMSELSSCSDDDSSDDDDDSMDFGDGLSDMEDLPRYLKGSYKILSFDQIRQSQEDDISNISTVLSISRAEATILLLYFKWDVRIITEKWFTGANKVRAQLRLIESPAIGLNSPTTSEITCEMCSGHVPEYLGPYVFCSHKFCTTCWQEFIGKSLRESRPLLRCPEETCYAPVNQDIISMLVSEAERKLHSSIVLRSYLANKGKRCPTPGCNHAVLLETGNSIYKFTCKCNYSFCYKCLKEAHHPLPCALVETWRTEPLKQSRNWTCLGSWFENGSGAGDQFSHICPKENLTQLAEVENNRAKVTSMLLRYQKCFTHFSSHDTDLEQILLKLRTLPRNELQALAEKQGLPLEEVSFVGDVWLQVAECKRVFKWACVYDFYFFIGQESRKSLYDTLIRQGAFVLDQLCLVASELRKFICTDAPTDQFEDFRQRLLFKSSIAHNFFENFEAAIRCEYLDMEILRLTICSRESIEMIPATDAGTSSDLTVSADAKPIIENGLCKKFCLNLCPEASTIIDVDECLDKPKRVCRSETLRIDEVLERNHLAFSLLIIYLAAFRCDGEIEKRICASSYGRVPDEEVSSEDDFDYSHIDDEFPTYWSSKGNKDPTISETVLYKTISNLCIIKEIRVLPFEVPLSLLTILTSSVSHPRVTDSKFKRHSLRKEQHKCSRGLTWYLIAAYKFLNLMPADYNEPKFPMYSGKAVRFSFGCRSPFIEQTASRSKYYDDDMFIWTYTSPEFPMPQNEAVQEFHLPRPIFCIGGIIKMELLGRVKKIVIENGMCKKFCLNLCPEASRIIDVDEVLDKPERVCRTETLKIDEVLERYHRAFSFLSIYLAAYRCAGEIEKRICASSYGRVPDEEVSSEDDFDYSHIDDENPTYWSSKGNKDPTISETVVYKTISNLCIIKEIHVQPFEADYDEPQFPTYSAKAVRFSFGCRSPFIEKRASRSKYYDDDMFIWTYTSPEFPMAQNKGVQEFHLPRPIFCIGGIIKMELLGRTKKNRFDGLYYVRQILEMARSYDFVERLPMELSMKILMCVYDSGTLAGCCGVSKAWRRFVIKNGLCKQLCLKLCPEASKIINVVEVLDKPERVCQSETLRINKMLERNHRAFSLLGIYLTSFRYDEEVEQKVCVSSYGRLPDEEVSSIDNENPTFWSSNGNKDPTNPDTVVFKTIRKLCVIKEIHLLNFEGTYVPEFPMYPAKAVRFSLGCRSPFIEKTASRSHYYDDDMFIWTYTSPEFPMPQNTGLHVFRLPRPIFSIGGIIKMELLGRVRKNNFDDLYYASVISYEPIRQDVCGMFDVDIVDDTGNCILK
ncbi:hypothetical protein KSS87_019494 [Heliosperma pusillum]|nr:hypothetical protein KSS87_019494 [Heliosperma pusillum]